MINQRNLDLMRAAKKGELNLAKAAVEQEPPIDIDWIDEKGTIVWTDQHQTALSVAVINRKEDIVDYLLIKGAKNILRKPFSHTTHTTYSHTMIDYALDPSSIRSNPQPHPAIGFKLIKAAILEANKNNDKAAMLQILNYINKFSQYVPLTNFLKEKEIRHCQNFLVVLFESVDDNEKALCETAKLVAQTDEAKQSDSKGSDAAIEVFLKLLPANVRRAWSHYQNAQMDLRKNNRIAAIMELGWATDLAFVPPIIKKFAQENDPVVKFFASYPSAANYPHKPWTMTLANGLKALEQKDYVQAIYWFQWAKNQGSLIAESLEADAFTQLDCRNLIPKVKAIIESLSVKVLAAKDSDEKTYIENSIPTFVKYCARASEKADEKEATPPASVALPVATLVPEQKTSASAAPATAIVLSHELANKAEVAYRSKQFSVAIQAYINIIWILAKHNTFNQIEIYFEKLKFLRVVASDEELKAIDSLDRFKLIKTAYGEIADKDGIKKTLDPAGIPVKELMQYIKASGHLLPKEKSLEIAIMLKTMSQWLYRESAVEGLEWFQAAVDEKQADSGTIGKSNLGFIYLRGANKNYKQALRNLSEAHDAYMAEGKLDESVIRSFAYFVELDTANDEDTINQAREKIIDIYEKIQKDPDKLKIFTDIISKNQIDCLKLYLVAANSFKANDVILDIKLLFMAKKKYNYGFIRTQIQSYLEQKEDLVKNRITKLMVFEETRDSKDNPAEQHYAKLKNALRANVIRSIKCGRIPQPSDIKSATGNTEEELEKLTDKDIARLATTQELVEAERTVNDFPEPWLSFFRAECASAGNGDYTHPNLLESIYWFQAAKSYNMMLAEVAEGHLYLQLENRRIKALKVNRILHSLDEKLRKGYQGSDRGFIESKMKLLAQKLQILQSAADHKELVPAAVSVPDQKSIKRVDTIFATKPAAAAKDIKSDSTHSKKLVQAEGLVLLSTLIEHANERYDLEDFSEAIRSYIQIVNLLIEREEYDEIEMFFDKLNMLRLVATDAELKQIDDLDQRRILAEATPKSSAASSTTASNAGAQAQSAASENIRLVTFNRYLKSAQGYECQAAAIGNSNKTKAILLRRKAIDYYMKLAKAGFRDVKVFLEHYSEVTAHVEVREYARQALSSLDYALANFASATSPGLHRAPRAESAASSTASQFQARAAFNK